MMNGAGTRVGEFLDDGDGVVATLCKLAGVLRPSEQHHQHSGGSSSNNRRTIGEVQGEKEEEEEEERQPGRNRGFEASCARLQTAAQQDREKSAWRAS